MSIWFGAVDLEGLNALGQSCANGHMGIELTRATDASLEGRMPVDHRTRQPFGVLAGGASALLAETLASIGGSLVIDPQKFHCVGLEVSANHVRAVPGGFVHGVATPAHLGRSYQLWDVTIRDDNGRTCCVSRVMLAVLDKAGRD